MAWPGRFQCFDLISDADPGAAFHVAHPFAGAPHVLLGQVSMVEEELDGRRNTDHKGQGSKRGSYPRTSLHGRWRMRASIHTPITMLRGGKRSLTTRSASVFRHA